METVLDAPVTSKELDYAGFWIRFLAYFIDAIILGVVQFILGLFMAGGGNSFVAGVNPVFQIINIVVGIAYFAILESSDKQATLGKMAVGIKVVSENGEKISFMNAVGRYLAKIISALILLIGFLMVAWDEKKQGLHDKLAKTYVVKA